MGSSRKRREKPVLAVTLGDPAGIGPEIVARVCHDPEVRLAAELLVVGRPMLLAAGALAAGLPEPEVEMVGAGEGLEIRPGQPNAACGRQSGAFVEMALNLCLGGRADAMVTAPISKKWLQTGGYPDTGHTTMLSRLTGTSRPVMMLAGARLKVILGTIHCPLSQVPALLHAKSLTETVLIASGDLTRYFGVGDPRVAVCGLNPHAGEEGLFGLEENEIIGPAVAAMRAAGVNAQGPLSPDTTFWQAAQGEFDLVLAMYHDQGLIPLKLLHFEDAVNVTLGLPIIRTSVDHGTAYGLAGKGKANPASLKAAILMARDMVIKRSQAQ